MDWKEIVAAVMTSITVVFVLITSFFLVRSVMSTQSDHVLEEKRWKALKGVGRHAEADILMLARPDNWLVVWRNGSPNMAAAELRVRFCDDAGTMHETILKTFIDQELLANFTTGKKLPILYSDGNPPLVAIDRERTQVSFVQNT
jgi:hypothetical protein